MRLGKAMRLWRQSCPRCPDYAEVLSYPHPDRSARYVQFDDRESGVRPDGVSWQSGGQFGAVVEVLGRSGRWETVAEWLVQDRGGLGI